MKQENNLSSMSKTDKDYISKLPDEILEKILTIHPFDSGSKEVALLTGLWHRPFIKHGGTTVNYQDLESEISNFLVSFDESNPLKMPRRLEYHYNKGLILTAIIGMDRKLHLDFSKGDQCLGNKFWLDIVLNTMDLAHTSPYPFSVNTLKLTSVNYSSYKFVMALVPKFRYVKNLIIEDCNGLISLTIEGLAKLLSISIQGCNDLNWVSVEALELKSFAYDGSLGWLMFKQVMYLEHVLLDFELGPRFISLNQRFYSTFLRATRDVKALTLHGWMYEYVFEPWLCSNQRDQHFKFSKLEDLWWIDSCLEDRTINSLLCFLKFCTSLKRLFITINPEVYSSQKPSARDHQRVSEVKKGRLRKLIVVKLEEVEKEVDVMLFKEKLMEVFNVEPRIIDVRQGMHDRCVIRIPKRQATGKAKESNKLKFCYKFVEEVEDDISLCLKHPHMPPKNHLFTCY